MQVQKENKLSVCKLPTPCLGSTLGLAHPRVCSPPGRCSPVWHSGPSLSLSQHSEQVVAVVHGPKSRLNAMCPVGIWSHGDQCHSGRTQFCIASPPCSHRKDPLGAYTPPESNAWCSSTNPQVPVLTSCKIMQTSQQHPLAGTRNTSLSSYYKAGPLLIQPIRVVMQP